jgi:hypothetical protein
MCPNLSLSDCHSSTVSPGPDTLPYAETSWQPGEGTDGVCLEMEFIIPARYWGLMPVILATQEAKIRRIKVQSLS